MTDILDFYEQEAKTQISDILWVSAIQNDALDDFKHYGFPKRQDEEWKYTSVDAFLKHQFAMPKEPSISTPKINKNIPFLRQLAIHNGQVVDVDGFIPSLPDGVIVMPLRAALSQHADKIKPVMGQLFDHEHGFHALNTASMQTGVFIYLPAGVSIDEPFVLAHWQDNANQAIYTRHIIIAEQNSHATIIETFHGDNECSYVTNTITEAHLSAGAKIVHYKIQCESLAAFHTGHTIVGQAGLSQFDSHSLSLGGKLVRSDLTFNLKEEQAHCLMNGIYLPSDKQHVDHHTVVHHLVPNSSSTQDYKGILSGQSRAVFNGKVAVAKNAQHTRAAQQNKNILLSPLAEIDTKPQLDIYADDVVCTHGATVGQLDSEALFYMAARGIPQADAIGYLIQAFAADNLRLVAHGDMVTWMSDLINQQLR